MKKTLNYRGMRTKPATSGMPKATRRDEMKTKVTKYNDHFTKYENEKGIVTVDDDTKEVKIELKNGKAKKRDDTTVLRGKCTIVNDNATKTIKALCDAFYIELDLKTSIVTLKLY